MSLKHLDNAHKLLLIQVKIMSSYLYTSIQTMKNVITSNQCITTRTSCLHDIRQLLSLCSTSGISTSFITGSSTLSVRIV